MFDKIFSKIKSAAKRRLDPIKVQRSMRCIYGPSDLKITKNQFVVVCMVKNGEFFMRDFLKYYFELGAFHIVFIDNGSTDNTIEIGKEYEHVSIIKCTLPAKHYETHMRQFAAYMFCKPDGWCLFADMDEFFDYPGKDSKSMNDVLNYLNENNYSAVVSQMVDMYPRGRLEDYDRSLSNGAFLDQHIYYESTNTELTKYHDRLNPHWYFLRSNTIPDARIQYASGGVRHRVFGTNNWLTKHPLVRLLPDVIPSTHPACSSGVACADFMGVLKHYKFAGDFANRVKNEVEAKTWDHGETETYHAIVTSTSPNLYNDQLSKKYISALSIIDNSYLFASDRFLKWINYK